MTPTHTSSVEVPSRMPHTSYDDKFCITKVTALITGNCAAWRESFSLTASWTAVTLTTPAMLPWTRSQSWWSSRRWWTRRWQRAECTSRWWTPSFLPSSRCDRVCDWKTARTPGKGDDQCDEEPLITTMWNTAVSSPEGEVPIPLWLVAFVYPSDCLSQQYLGQISSNSDWDWQIGWGLGSGTALLVFYPIGQGSRSQHGNIVLA